MYIYIITNKIDGKKYVGQTTRNDPMDRVNEHFKISGGGSEYLQHAIQKHGKDNFDIEIISYLGASQKALDAIEQWQIKKNNSLSPNGYNLTGGGNSGGKISDEIKQKLSKITKEKMKNPALRKKISERTKEEMNKPEVKKRIAKTQYRHPIWKNQKAITGIIKLYCEKRISANRISLRYDCSDSTIRNILKSNGIKMRTCNEGTKNSKEAIQKRKHPAWQHICEIVRLRFEERKTYQYIADIYGCSDTTASEICKSI